MKRTSYDAQYCAVFSSIPPLLLHKSKYSSQRPLLKGRRFWTEWQQAFSKFNLLTFFCFVFDSNLN